VTTQLALEVLDLVIGEVTDDLFGVPMMLSRVPLMSGCLQLRIPVEGARSD